MCGVQIIFNGNRLKLFSKDTPEMRTPLTFSFNKNSYCMHLKKG
jgi:hypothetical protein